MDEEILIDAQINPLAFIKAEPPFSEFLGNDVSLEDVLDYLCTPGLPSDIKSLLARHKEIQSINLFAAPAEENILSKLIWPLRHAKGCYMVGNYLGTIALCGMVAEMMAILFYEISDSSTTPPTTAAASSTIARVLKSILFEKLNKNKPSDGKDEKKRLSGREFERLGQERRVDNLYALGFVDKPLKQHFDKIRKKRRQYLHFYSKQHRLLEKDAVEVFSSTVAILVALIGQEIHEGKLLLNPNLLRYLERIGLAKLR